MSIKNPLIEKVITDNIEYNNKDIKGSVVFKNVNFSYNKNEHVLKNLNIDCDFMVGAQLEGFETMVRLTHNSKIFILEGDEYLSSPIDKRPKFYKAVATKGRTCKSRTDQES